LRREFIALILAFLLIELTLDAAYIIHNGPWSKIEEENDHIEEGRVLTPEEVNMTLNISSRGVTNHSNDFSVEGAPEGSNITWSLNDETKGYGPSLGLNFYEAGHFNLTAMVSWDVYKINLSETLSINRPNNEGDFTLVYPWYVPVEISPVMGIIDTILPGLTEPTMWINLSMTLGNTYVKFWLELQEEDKIEPFEVLDYDIIPVGSLQYSRTFFLDKDFFDLHENREPYFISIRMEIGNPDSGTMVCEVHSTLRY